ncbi:MAG: efflux RND transporter periplasmic adaptor subunit [Rhodoferax sp.]
MGYVFSIPATMIYPNPQYRRALLSVAGAALLAVSHPTLGQSSVVVDVAPVRSTSAAAFLEMDATIQPVRQTTVAAQTSGRLTRFLVSAGQAVQAGQLLAVIDAQETDAGVQRSQAQANQAQAELEQAQANFRRTHELRQKNFVSQAALDAAQTQLKAAQAALEQARAGQTQSRLASTYTRVIAPYDGLIWQTHAEVGDLAVPGKPLVTLYAPKPLRAVAQVSVSNIPVTSAADTAEVGFKDAAGKEYWLTPVRTTRLTAADPVSQTVEWRFDLPDSATTGVLPGQSVRVRFKGIPAPARLAVPASALLRRGELTAVYVVQNGHFVLRPVRSGAELPGSTVEVLAGLAPTDRIALDPVRAGLAGAQPKP